MPARYESWSSSVCAAVPLRSDIELQAHASVFRDDRTLRFAGADSCSEGMDASILLIGRGAWQIDALAYVQARDFGNVVISATNFRTTLGQRKTPSTGIGGKIGLRPPVGKAYVLRIGADTRYSTGDMFEDPYSTVTGLETARRHAGGDQTTTGVFIEDDWTSGRLILTGGARADRWSIRNGFNDSTSPAGVLTHIGYADRNGWRASFRGGALLRLSEAGSVRAAAYTGFRLPTLNELYRGFVVFPITTQANAALKPETLKGAEAGFDVKPVGGVTLSASAFLIHVENAIANVTLNATTRRRQNVDAIVAKGIELNASARRNDVSLSASYAYTDSKVKAPGQAFDGLRPAQTPAHAASATLAWAPARGPSLSATLRYVGKQHEDDLQTDVLPDALTVDGTASLPLAHGASLVGRIENLFDKAVITRNAGGSIDLGTPRTIWVGVRFAR